MQAYHLNNSVLTVSPPDSNFTPRKEFVRDIQRTASTYALLSIAGAGCIRLCSFPPQLIESMKLLFGRHHILRRYREDPELHLSEFTVTGKPWAANKSLESEKLFLEILWVIFFHGFAFVSTLDYGREADDRVSVVFSKPVTPPTSPNASRNLQALSKVPFALSFPSAKVLRVIDPPLSSTPAILQSVRSAWPRGVVSEKKVANSCFEFRLKGYKWIEEDKTSTDSLKYIFALLNSLDSFGFSLITSLSLTSSHSRVKDLWIFSGAPPEGPTDGESSNASLSDLVPPSPPFAVLEKRSREFQNLSGQNSREELNTQESSHRRSRSDGHMFQSNGPPIAPGLTASQSLLRKKPHLKSSPLMDNPPLTVPEEEDSINEAVNMAGIGTRRTMNPGFTNPAFSAEDNGEIPHPDRQADVQPPTRQVLYTTGNDLAKQFAGRYLAANGVPPSSWSPPREVPPPAPAAQQASGAQDPQRRLTIRNSRPPPSGVPQSVYGHISPEPEQQQPEAGEPQVMNSRVFRDSAFSSMTREVPVSYIGADGEREGKHSYEYDSKWPMSPEQVTGNEPDNNTPNSLSPPNSSSGRQSSSPERMGNDEQISHSHSPSPERASRMKGGYASPEPKNVDAVRMASPVTSELDEASRRSEIASLAVASSAPPSHRQPSVSHHVSHSLHPSHPPHSSHLSHPSHSSHPLHSPHSTLQPPRLEPVRERKESSSPPVPGVGGGWVMVNIEGVQMEEQFRSRSPPSGSRSRTTSPQSLPEPQAVSMSPAAKMLAAADAVAPETEKPKSGSRLATLKNLIIRNKSRDEKLLADGRVVRVKTDESDLRSRSPPQREETTSPKQRRVSFARNSRSKLKPDTMPSSSTRVRVKLDD